MAIVHHDALGAPAHGLEGFGQEHLAVEPVELLVEADVHQPGISQHQTGALALHPLASDLDDVGRGVVLGLLPRARYDAAHPLLKLAPSYPVLPAEAD